MSSLFLKSDPTLADIQKYVEEMETERGFSHQSVLQTYLLMIEEVGELAKIVRKSHAVMRTDSAKEYDDDAGAEVADILLVLIAVANRMGVDIEESLRQKEEKNKQRTWK